MKKKILNATTLFYLLSIVLLQTAFLSTTAYAQSQRLWGTYYGGTINEIGQDIATDASGNVYMVGVTSSIAGIASGGFQNTTSGAFYDAYLVKFDPAGARLWGTYFGGANIEFGWSVAVDASGNVYLAGYTNSNTSIAFGGFQTIYGGGTPVAGDAFVAKFDSNGHLLWSTYYGGPGEDFGYGVAVDGSGNVFLAGVTKSASGIASSGFQNIYGGGSTYGDAFLVKFNSSGTRLWATYYGGTNDDYGDAVAVDASGDVYLAGYTGSTNAIASAGFQNTKSLAYDAFLVKFSSSGTRQWGTYYGGVGTEQGLDVAIDASGNPYLSGITSSPSGISSGGFQNTYGGLGDAFLVKFNPSGTRLWATYYGGSGGDWIYGINPTPSGYVYVAGATSSTNAISSGGFQNTYGGNPRDAFLATFDSDGNYFCATYYGGTDWEYGYSAASDPSGNVYLTGYSMSTNAIAIANGGFQNTPGGLNEAFLVKFTPCCNALTTSPDFTICYGDSTVLTVNGGSNYTWAPSESLNSPIGNMVTASPTITTTYTVTSPGSCTTTIEVKVNALPSLLVTPNSVLCNGDPPLTLGATGAAYYSWSSSDGLSATTGGSVTASPTATITYSITATDINGCIATSEVTITVQNYLLLNAGNDVTVCIGSGITLNASGGSNYLWAPSNGLSNASIFNPIANPTTTTTYSLTALSAICPVTDDAIVVSVIPVPVITASSDVTMCDGNSTVISAFGALLYNWSPPENLGSASNNSTAAFPSVTTTYTVTGTDINSCKAIEAVTLSVLPAVTAYAGSDIIICNGSSTILTATGGTLYTWSPGTSLNTTSGHTVIFTGSVQSSNTITLTAYTENCKDTDDVIISVLDLPIINAVGNATICSGTSTVLSASGANSYNWIPSSTLSPPTGNMVTASPVTTTTYTIIGTGSNGCSGNNTLTITVYTAPTALFTFQPQHATLLNPTIQFIDASFFNISSWLWNFGDPQENSSALQNPAYTYSDIGNYIVQLIVTDIHGCTDTTQQPLSIDADYVFFAPNSFTPNEDGVNDIFFPLVDGIIPEEFSLIIFDRWGNKIFESDDFKTGWDGKVKNGTIVAQQDVYVYVVKLIDYKKTKHLYTGRITLIR